MDNYQIVLLPNGEVLAEDNKLYMQHKIDGTLLLVEATEEIKKHFGIGSVEESNNSCSDFSTDTEASCSSRVWSKAAILTLIDLMKENDNRFKSTTEKNEKVWQDVAVSMNERNITVTATQCRDKWKYLKMRYMKKKDNMGNKETGTAPIKFEYFEELDELLGKKHNVQPVAVAASLEGNTIPHREENNNVFEEAPPKKRKFSKTNKKQDVLETLVKEIQKSTNAREEHREQERKARAEVVKVFSEKMDTLINAITKK